MQCPCRRPWCRMESSRVALALFALFCVLSYHGADSVQCFVCNNANHYEGERCDNPEEYIGVEDKDVLKDCVEEGARDGLNYTLCRKIVQDVEDEIRVVRSCATHGNTDKCIDRTGTLKVRVTYCECEGDKCNSATHSAPQVILSTFIALFVAVKAVL